ncbi:MAG: hypothetical protein KF901_10230 [Myxococcales bacterium]|nr:hypothetical protein [Myxococcales bacterium]
MAGLAWLAALGSPDTAAADRPDTPGTTELFRYEAEDIVESHPSPGGAFRVHFTRLGVHAVPARDDDESGVPDHVERVAEIYDEVLAFYRELGFRAPLSDASIVDNGGDDRFDVYLLDFGGSADGAFRTDACGVDGARPTQCVGFMVQENDFVGYGYPTVTYASRLLASHELFHAVQAAYHAGRGSVLGEGTAVWASKVFDATLRDLEHFARGYLDNTDRPIDRPLPGPIDPFSYGTGIFFRFLEERYEPDLIRALWEGTETEEWMPALDGLLMLDHGTSFGEAFREFAEWNLFTGPRADTTRAYSDGARFPLVKTTAVTLPHRAPALRVFHASAHYFVAPPAGRGPVTAALVGDAEGLELFLALRRLDEITLVSPGADASMANEVIAVVVNPSLAGSARRPDLCFGGLAEVEACVAASTVTPDAGVELPDAGMPDSSPDTGFPDDEPDAPKGCSCRTLRGDDGPGALLLLLATLALRRRSGDRSAP